MDAITATCAVPADHADKMTCSYYNDKFDCNIFVVGIARGCEYDELGEVGQDVVFPS